MLGVLCPRHVPSVGSLLCTCMHAMLMQDIQLISPCAQQGESSTGAHQALGGVAEACRKHDTVCKGHDFLHFMMPGHSM